MNPKLVSTLKVAVPTVLAILAYLLQVDPLSLCKPVPQPAPSVQDAGAP